VTLLAFAAERLRAAVRRCCLAPVQQSIDISCPRGAQQQTRRTLLQRSIDGTDRQTDGRTPDTAYYCANGVDNRRCGECQLLGSETPRPKYTPNATTYACTTIRAWESAESGRK